MTARQVVEMERRIERLLELPQARQLLAHGGANTTLMMDTGDGRPGSEEDNRCDGCLRVQKDGVHLVSWIFEPAKAEGHWKLVAGPGATELLFSEITATGSPRLVVTLGLCLGCIGIAEAHREALFQAQQQAKEARDASERN